MNKVIEKLMRFLVIVLFLIYGINLLVYICIDRILDAEEVEKLNRVPNKYVYNEIGFEGPT
ncbi:MAG: hypothetical protein GTO02_12585, partial [Candidatus Dadabacteria bacterium]|nr:hypothetical protein [Candidatus Dadabacteria bacterium]NIQ15187.1 hypothetical protein [Candidatus Dadabacteria bacterium]